MTTTPTTATDEAPVEVDHEIDTYYSSLPGPQQTCIMRCSCGVSARGPLWAGVGAAMDRHLEEVSQ